MKTIQYKGKKYDGFYAAAKAAGISVDKFYRDEKWKHVEKKEATKPINKDGDDVK